MIRSKEGSPHSSDSSSPVHRSRSGGSGSSGGSSGGAERGAGGGGTGHGNGSPRAASRNPSSHQNLSRNGNGNGNINGNGTARVPSASRHSVHEQQQQQSRPAELIVEPPSGTLAAPSGGGRSGGPSSASLASSSSSSSAVPMSASATASTAPPPHSANGVAGGSSPAQKQALSQKQQSSTAGSTPVAAGRKSFAKRTIKVEAGTFTADRAVVDRFLDSQSVVTRLANWAGRLGTDNSTPPQATTSATGAPVASYVPSEAQERMADYRRLTFGSNRVHSARYTLLSFVPVNLWEQVVPWNKPANFYFIMIAVLQSISAISTTNGRPSILVPLFFVLTVTAIKDAIEDYHRAKSDRAKNLAVYQAYRRSDDGNSKSGQTGQWVKEYSKDILVGDLIRIYENQRIPADVLLLASGIDKCTHAFVDTKDLDGETNLKPKFVPLNVLKYLKGAADLAAAQQPEELQAASNGGGNGFGSAGDGGAGAGSPSATALSDMQNAIMLRRLQRMRLELECDEPNGDMSEWHATLTIQPPVPSGGGQSSARASAVGGAGAGVTPFVQNLGLDALILSECVVRNTPFVIGLVCYTGDGTKLRQNMSKQLNNARIKETSVFRLTKKLFAFMALAQLLLCIAAAIACGILQGRVQDSALYLQFRNSPATAGFLQFFSWFILCKDFVPISLYVSMELVQFWQALFMGLDEKMAVQQIKVLSHEEEAADEKQQQQQMTTSVNGRQRGASGSKSSGIGFEAPSHQAHEPAASASGVALSPASAPSAGSGSGGGGGGPRVVYETIYAKAQTSRLNEGLSEVSFVFSDKTGTLTQNSMIFKKCVIGSARYGLTSTEAGVIRRAKLENRSVDSALREFSAQRETREARRRAEGLVPFPHVEFDQADELAAALAGAGPPPGSEASSGSFSSSASSGSSSAHNEQHAREVREFLLALALNNAVFPKVDPMRSGAPDASAVQLPPARGPRQSLLQVSPLHGGGVIGGSGAGSKSSAAPAGPRYDLSNPCTNAVMALDSSSPDEKALCYFAQYLGFELFARAGGRTKLRVRDPPQQSSKSQSAARNAKNNSAASTSGGGGTLAHFEEYADVCMLDFSAKRKRMTVLVEEINPSTGQPNGKIKVLCKGADSFVYPLLAGASASEAAHLEPQGELDPVDNQPSPLGLATPARGGGGGGGSDSPVRKSPLTPLHGSSPAGAAGSASPPGSNSSSPNAPSGPRNWDWTYSCLTEMGGESLRTLIVASGERERSWWFGSDATGSDGLKSVYERTQRAQGESEKGHTDGSCSSSCSMCAIETRIEREAGMHIVGATAIEDLLQQGVGPALKQLLDAKISIWVLTGDNVSTAINIGISCNLLEADFEKDGRLFKLDREQAGSLAQLSAVMSDAQALVDHTLKHNPDANFGLALHSDAWKLLYVDEDEEEEHEDGDGATKKKKAKTPPSAPKAGAISGLRQPRSSESRMHQRAVLSQFFELTSRCRSVIACRLEPKEKAQIVEEMRRRTGKVCLAIGDGNNDTPMIRCADIGVGIRGVEGTSAVANADYVISQWRFLPRLLLGYGHLNYRRMSLLICYIFYKSSMLVWMAYFLGAHSMFSAQTLTLEWAFQLFNIAYSALPILIVAVLDRDFDFDFLEAHPLIYAATRGDSYFNPSIIARWLLAGFVDSLLCFFIPWYAYDMSGGGIRGAVQEGQDVGFVAMGLVAYTCLCMVVNIKLAFFVRSWTWIHTASFAASIGVYWLATGIFNASSFFKIGGLDYFSVLTFVGLQPRFWLTLLLCLGCSSLLNLLYLAVVETLWPATPVCIYYEAARMQAMGKKGSEQLVEACDREYEQAEARGWTTRRRSSRSRIGGGGSGTHVHDDYDATCKNGDVIQVRPALRSTGGSHKGCGGGGGGGEEMTSMSPSALTNIPILSPDATDAALYAAVDHQGGNGTGSDGGMFSPSSLPFSPVAQQGSSPKNNGVEVRGGGRSVLSPNSIYDAGQAHTPLRVNLPNAASSTPPDHDKRVLAAQQQQGAHGRAQSRPSLGAGHASNAAQQQQQQQQQQPQSQQHRHLSVNARSSASLSTSPASNAPAYSGFAFSHTPSVRVLHLNQDGGAINEQDDQA